MKRVDAVTGDELRALADARAPFHEWIDYACDACGKTWRATLIPGPDLRVIYMVADDACGCQDGRRRMVGGHTIL